MDPESSARRLRIGHAERDAVIETLREAAGDGRLTVEELTERMELAAAARTYADLDPLVEDLPVPRPSAAVEGAAGLGAAAASGAVVPAGGGAPLVPARQGEPGWEPHRPLVLKGGWDTEYRRGNWRVPPYLRVESGMGTVELNFLEVALVPQEISLEVSGDMGTLVIVVPEGWGADTNEVAKSWGSVTNKVGDLPSHGGSLIRVSGKMGMGSLTIRHANWFDRRRLERR
ncbi:DUF1707 SHOCT-like domain-containing protein [Brevibacterium album]|uniref:DUF1707 SHOCT-like domain-containing protein n=1 Tax=Brevibacterium album TaxID=417948 RepID=UPI000405003B|nr:DUF1707 domain-containing protein [Brevibacterium album]